MIMLYSAGELRKDEADSFRRKLHCGGALLRRGARAFEIHVLHEVTQGKGDTTFG